MGLPHINYFDSGEFHAWFENLLCPNCGNTGAVGLIPGKGPHFGHPECMTCGYRHDWLPMPKQEAEQKARRRSRRPSLPPDEDYCRFCNIDASFAKKLGLRMEWAHPRDRAALIEAGLPPDGDDLIRCCSECHQSIDAQRRRIDRLRRLLEANADEDEEAV
jgi:hypothetical protein